MANLNWFDPKVYFDNKLAQLQAVDPTGKNNGNKAWDADSLTKALENGGYKGDEGLFRHFSDYGMSENISPNEAFDANFYLAAKADALNQVNFQNKTWDAVSVMDAIKAAGLHSAWEHYQLYGSTEGISTSADFNTSDYFIAKVAEMNATKEEGRNDWTIDEVKAIFAANGLTALEHYNLYGKDEKLNEYAPKGVDFTHADTPEASSDGFDPYTGAQNYSLEEALKAQADGSLATTYTLTDSDPKALDAGDVTIAQQAELKDFVAGATNGATYAKAEIAYHLNDSVANLANVAASVLQGSDGDYTVTDAVANIAVGNMVTLKEAGDVVAKISSDVSLTYATDTLAHLATIYSYDTTGLAKDKTANITVDASAESKDVALDLNAAKGEHLADYGLVTLSATGGAGNDYLGGDAHANTLVGGNGADWLSGGKGDDILFAGSMTSLDANKVYAQGSESIKADAVNTEFSDTIFGPTGSNWITPDVQSTFFKGHNILEGREGDDTLVASAGKDLFLFQTGGGGDTGKKLELSFTELGKDTIHNFHVGEDVLFIMNQSENGEGGKPTGINHKYSAGWSADALNNTANVTIDWHGGHTSATVTVLEGGAFGIADGGNLVIELVGVQGADAGTTVADLFGVAAPAA